MARGGTIGAEGYRCMGNEGIVEAIAREERLGPVEEKLQGALHEVFRRAGPAGQSTKNFLHGTWLGHPLHAVLTDVPIGAWTAAAALDVLDAVEGGERFSAAADAVLGLGIAGALGAAVTGLTDWQDTDPPARRIGLTHGLLNVAGVALMTASWIARRRDRRAAGRGLSALGFAVATAAARLGGNMVYGQRVGVDHTAGQTLPGEFVAVVAESDMVEGKPLRANCNGVPILLVKKGDRVFALLETCSHLGGPLSEGEVVEDTVKCPWHGSRFALEDGRVVDGPAVHPQPCLDARVRQGQVEVRKASGQPMALSAT